MFNSVQQQIHCPYLEQGHGLAQVGISHNDVQAPPFIALGVGFVAGINHGA